MTQDIFNKGIRRLQVVFPRRSIIPGFYWTQLKDISDQAFIEVVLAVTKNPMDLHPDRDLVEAIKSGVKHLRRAVIPQHRADEQNKNLERWKAERAEEIPPEWTALKNKLKGTHA